MNSNNLSFTGRLTNIMWEVKTICLWQGWMWMSGIYLVGMGLFGCPSSTYCPVWLSQCGNFKFFCYSDFTWNYFWQLRISRSSIFDTFRGSKFLFLKNSTFLNDQNCQKSNSRAFEFVWLDIFELLQCLNLISRKFWVAEISTLWSQQHSVEISTIYSHHFRYLYAKMS